MGRARSWGRKESVEPYATRLLGQEGLVRRVLEKPAHQIRHPRDEVANRAIAARPEPCAGQRVGEVVAKAAEDLELERIVRASREAVVSDGVSDRAQIVGSDGYANLPRIRACMVDEAAGECLEAPV